MGVRTTQAAKKAAIASLGLGVILAIPSPEMAATLAAFAALAAILLLLSVKDEPPILLFPALMQWLQVALVPISTLWLGQEMSLLADYGGADLSAALFGLAGVTMLAAGLRFGAWGFSRSRNLLQILRAECGAWPARYVLLLALAAISIGYLAEGGARYGASTRELFNQVSQIKYAGLFLLTFWCLRTGQKSTLLVAIVGADIVMGMTGFFAEFKQTVIVVAMAVFCARSSFKLRDQLVVCVAFSLVFATAIFWSAIKAEYRLFLNLGTGAQIVAVDQDERLSYVLDQLSTFDLEAAQYGFEKLVSRYGYIDFLGLTLDYVPDTVDHVYGAQTLAAIQHILMPRLLFPNKPPLPNDTDVMARFTGLPNLWNQNTSISIGYLGEFYIDFGWIGALLAAFGLGSLAGRLYAIIRDHRTSPLLLRISLCPLIVLPISNFETALAKVVGALVFSMIITLFAQRFALPFLFARILGKMNAFGRWRQLRS